MTIATLLESLAVIRDEFGKVWQELAGEVVDDGVAEVLEELRGRGLPAAGQARHDRDVLVGRRAPAPDQRRVTVGRWPYGSV